MLLLRRHLGIQHNKKHKEENSSPQTKGRVKSHGHRSMILW